MIVKSQDFSKDSWTKRPFSEEKMHYWGGDFNSNQGLLSPLVLPLSPIPCHLICKTSFFTPSFDTYEGFTHEIMEAERPYKLLSSECVHVYTLSHIRLLGPHGLWPTRLLYPQDFPGKNTRMCCHFLLHWLCIV